MRGEHHRSHARHQQQERQPRGVDPPAPVVREQPVVDRGLVRHQRAGFVDAGQAAHRHEPVRRRRSRHAGEPVVAHRIPIGQGARGGKIRTREQPQHGRLVERRVELVLERLDEPVHEIRLAGLRVRHLRRHRALVMRQIARERTVLGPEGSKPHAVAVRVQVADVAGVGDPLDVGAVAVLRAAQVSEHVVERSVLHHDHDDGVDVLLELARIHGCPSGLHCAYASTTRLCGSAAVPHASPGKRGDDNTQSPTMG